MKTTVYNPSPLEVALAKALNNLQHEISNQLKTKQITGAVTDITQDNPSVKFTLKDEDGDLHELVVKIVQVPDKP